MSDLGDLIGQAHLGEQPATVTVDVYARALAEIRTARAEIDRLARELGYARSRATALDTLRREAAGQLNQATTEIERLRAARQWIVARDSGYTCRDCERDIRRGEAYELLDGVDEYRHVHCPDAPDGGLPGGESTSAALRRVEQERDALLAFLRGTQEIAKDRNRGQEPDDLHLAYEREMARLRAENERLTAERDSARTEVDVLRRAEAREIRALREQLDDARDEYGDKLCPRCGVELAAEVAAENGES